MVVENLKVHKDGKGPSAVCPTCGPIRAKCPHFGADEVDASIEAWTKTVRKAEGCMTNISEVLNAVSSKETVVVSKRRDAPTPEEKEVVFAFVGESWTKDGEPCKAGEVVVYLGAAVKASLSNPGDVAVKVRVRADPATSGGKT